MANNPWPSSKCLFSHALFVMDITNKYPVTLPSLGKDVWSQYNGTTTSLGHRVFKSS